MLVNGPAIPINGDDVHVLSTPVEFYEQLIQNISQAKDLLVITSLYIGNGELEEKLYREIESFLERGGSATIIVDHGRGLRGEKKSTYARCLKMYKQYHHNLTLGYFYSPLVEQSIVAKRISQLQETLATQHTKIYLADDKLILSGANLESAYFTNRQDRYIQFSNRKLGNFFSILAQIITKHSYLMHSPDEGLNDARKVDFSSFKADVNAHLSNFDGLKESKHDTLFHPSVQAGWADVRNDEHLLESVLSNLTKEDKMYFCSGYFNPPSPLCQAISSTKASVELLSADCRANGFYKAKFPKSGITPAYQLFADDMLEELGSKELNYNEWNRDQWTFHAKGMWFYTSSSCFAASIGSSNFSHRSYLKDLEAGGLISTQNKSLQNALDAERSRIWAHAHERNTSIQKVPNWVKKVAPRLKAFF